MKKFRNIARIIFGVFLLVAIGWGSYFLIARFLYFLISIKSDVATALVAFLTAVMVSVGSVLITKYLENRAAIQQKNREKKIPVYEDFIAYFLTFIHKYKEEGGEESVDKIRKYTEQIIIWGSDDIVKSYSQFRDSAISGKKGGIETLYSFEKLLFAIRKDLGHKNKELSEGTILKLFINDLEKYKKIDK